MKILKLVAIFGAFVFLTSVPMVCQQKSSATATIVITAKLVTPTAFEFQPAKPRSQQPMISTNATQSAHGYEIILPPTPQLVREDREVNDCAIPNGKAQCRLLTITVTPKDF